MTLRAHRDVPSSIVLLITLAAVLASVGLVLSTPSLLNTLSDHPGRFAAFLLLALGLQLCSVDVYGRGSMSVSAVGFLAAGFVLGPGPAMVIAVVAAVAQWARGRGVLYKAVFDAANFALATGAAALAYEVATGVSDSTAMQIGGAAYAGLVFVLINTGLLCLAISLDQSLPIGELWRERFRWATGYQLAFGLLALAATIAWERVGFAGLIAFVLPPVLMLLSVRQYLARTREAVEEIRRGNEELSVANTALAARNEDLNDLFQFASGLASRAHDRGALVTYAEDAIGRVAGGHARVLAEPGEHGTPLLAGETRVGTLLLEHRGEGGAARWERLRDVVLPQLATAIESADLVEQVRKTHLATIAALSRSMEAKDYYTGGHTERVSSVAVALAARLGYAGPDLDAIEIGALLHDIGKIGIPERILHKPSDLDDEEWKVMKEHPVISEYILSGVELPGIVLQIARSSHEHFDGSGYPDGRFGEEIPLPARIVLVADAFDALTSDRPYRRGRHLRAALDEIRAHTGSQFCPSVVAALEAVHREAPQILGGTVLRAVDVA